MDLQEHSLPGLTINAQLDQTIAWIHLKGYVNMETADVLLNVVIRDYYEKHKCVRYVFDVEELDYVSSAGVGVFMELYGRIEGLGGRIVFIHLHEEIQRVFELVGFMKYFGTVSSREQAQAFLDS